MKAAGREAIAKDYPGNPARLSELVEFEGRIDFIEDLKSLTGTAAGGGLARAKLLNDVLVAKDVAEHILHLLLLVQQGSPILIATFENLQIALLCHKLAKLV